MKETEWKRWSGGSVSFVNQETGKSIYIHTSRSYHAVDENGNGLHDENGDCIYIDYPNGATEGKLLAGQYLPSGDYKIYSIGISDNAGNSRSLFNEELYDRDSQTYINRFPEALRNLIITVINNGYIKPKPVPVLVPVEDETDVPEDNNDEPIDNNNDEPVENNDETPENNIVVVDDQPYKVVIVNANQPTGYEFTNYIPEVPSQGDVETKTVGNVPGYNVEISNTETVAHMKEQLLTLDERLEVARGKNVDFTIEFNDGESAVSPAVKAKVEATIGSGTIAKWLDISVFKQLEGAEKTPVEKPNGKMKLQISVPDDILALAASGAQFELICVVDGEVVRIPATYNAETNTIDFETAVFGVFALVYTA